MHIGRVDPTCIRGDAGERIRALADWLKHVDGNFRPDAPYFDRLVITSAKADGDHIPKIGYVGKSSHIKRIMEGQHGADLAAAIRSQDPNFDKVVAGGFARAAEGAIVSELVEMEVTPPGFLRPIQTSYYRFIARLNMGQPVLINLTLPEPHRFQPHLIGLDKECRLPS